ncbi:MAG: aldose 1-epimerase [Acidimicrobiia bacterium]|nr:aldose 1-epimerase [Acidimicrobiia bacterium]
MSSSLLARGAVALAASGVWLTAAPTAQQRHGAVQQGDIVRLTDRTADIEVSILPSVGNIAFDMQVAGHHVLRFPYQSVEEFKARPAMTALPFMGPWANRLDEPAFYANGQRYSFDLRIGNVRAPIPIHGFLTTTDAWRVIDVRAGRDGASVTSRLDFFRQPSWMKQWPFAHTIEMTYRLADGALEVDTTITNLSADPMPVSVGFHPYFQLSDSPRDDWTIAIGARTRWVLDADKVPTGVTEPVEALLPGGRAQLRDYNLDEVFSDLVRDASGRATMTVHGRTQRLDVVLGPRYRAVVAWAPNPRGTGRGGQGPSPPAERNFVCIEPMVAISNALNMAARGTYTELQTVEPGGVWRESFWIRPSGFRL